MSPILCSNCRRPAEGGAKSLCPRCYRHHLRHGELPPAEMLHVEDGEQIRVTLAGPTLAHARDIAEREGVRLATWVRKQVEGAVFREVGRRVAGRGKGPR